MNAQAVEQGPAAMVPHRIQPVGHDLQGQRRDVYPPPHTATSFALRNGLLTYPGERNVIAKEMSMSLSGLSSASGLYLGWVRAIRATTAFTLRETRSTPPHCQTGTRATCGTGVETRQEGEGFCEQEQSSLNSRHGSSRVLMVGVDKSQQPRHQESTV